MNVKVSFAIFAFLFFVNASITQAHEGHDHELPTGIKKIIDYQTQLATGLSFLAAFLAGIISFMSPCGLPVIPAFFGVAFKHKQQIMRNAALFCLGLVSSFTILGIIAGLASNIFDQFKNSIAIVSGVFFILFGILTLINKNIGTTCKIPKQQTNSHVYWFGILFGLGWTPCIAAVLGSIFFLAFTLGSVIKSTLLAITFALGVSTPLLFFSYYADKLHWQPTGKKITLTLFGKIQETYLYNILAGALLILIGIIMLTWQGTGFFMSEIPKILPWNMELLVEWNQVLVTNSFLTSWLANVIGITLAGIIIIITVFALKKIHFKQNQ